MEFSAEEFETALITPNDTLGDIHMPLLKVGEFVQLHLILVEVEIFCKLGVVPSQLTVVLLAVVIPFTKL